MEPILKHLSILGHKVRDRITKLEGVAATVTFDLYGCIQVVVDPGLDKDGKQRDRCWLDISRLEVLDEVVMAPPDYIAGAIAEGKQGAAEKPRSDRY